MLHQKTDGIAAFTTTKTFIDLFGRRHSERWSSFIMKRAKTEIVGTPLFQFHKTADHINNINAAQYLLYRIL